MQIKRCYNYSNKKDNTFCFVQHLLYITNRTCPALWKLREAQSSQPDGAGNAVLNFYFRGASVGVLRGREEFFVRKISSQHKCEAFCDVSFPLSHFFLDTFSFGKQKVSPRRALRTQAHTINSGNFPQSAKLSL